MRILVANDDGIHSPGIAALARVASRFGEVRVVAPDVEQSSASHAVTASRPLSYRRSTSPEGVEAWRVNGTPADCVALGVHHWSDVDLVLSGINIGTNLGNGLWHSGTLAAAKQATLFGLRGIALSTPSTAPGGEEPDFAALEPHVERVLAALIPLTSARLLNVNLPMNPRGMAWTRQAVRHYDGRIVPDRGPDGPHPLLVHRRPDRRAPSRAPTCGPWSAATSRSRRSASTSPTRSRSSDSAAS